MSSDMKRTTGGRQALVILVGLALLSTGTGAAWAGEPPQLVEPIPIDHVITTGHVVEFQIRYKDAENDPPLEAGVKITTPSGSKIDKSLASGDLAGIHSGSLITIIMTPQESGNYDYYFYVRDADGRTTFPEGEALHFRVAPNWLPWAIIVCGFIVSFIIISPLIYQVMHRMAGAAHTSSARVALMVGIICWILAVVYAVNSFYATDPLSRGLAWGAAALAAIVLFVWAMVAR